MLKSLSKQQFMNWEALLPKGFSALLTKHWVNTEVQCNYLIGCSSKIDIFGLPYCEVPDHIILCWLAVSDD